MDKPFEPSDDETRNPSCPFASTLPQDAVEVYGVRRIHGLSVDGDLAVVDEIGTAGQSAQPVGAFGEAEGGVECAAGVVHGQELCVATGDTKEAALLMDLDGHGGCHHAMAQVGKLAWSGWLKGMDEGAAVEGVALLHVGLHGGGEAQEEGHSKDAWEDVLSMWSRFCHAFCLPNLGQR